MTARQRFENWGALRALCSPAFFRSTIRASRVRKPARFSGTRSSGSASTSARAMPWRTAPAWPLGPPPCTRTRRSNVPSTPATLSGDSACSRWVARGKYCSIVRPLNQVVPSPGRRVTRATEVFRLPVPWYWAWFIRSPLTSSGLGQSFQTDAQAKPAHPDTGAASVASSRAHLQLRRCLRLVRVLGAGVDLQLAHLGAGEAGAGEHPLHGLAQHL